MQTIKAGQRFMSEAEPELGLGLVTELQDKMIHLDFPAVSETRCYGIKSAPIKRIRFNIGDEVSSNEQVKFIVSEVSKTDEGQLLYISENGLQLLESNLLHSISFQRAEQKLLNASPDSDKLFQLRIKTAQIDSWLQNLPVRGLLGGRVSLIPHQLYIANEVTKRLSPRVLLADEVGLGKTIEAGLILHKLLITHKIERALIVLPNSLCFQWFVEMYRKYNLQFTVIDKINNELLADSNGQNLFDQNNLVITSIDLLSESEFALDSVQKVHWDMLIVDEAHKLKWQESNASKQYTIIEKLSKQINGLLLLTATPEMFGPKEHFSRLRLIDPDRFYDFDLYQKENLKHKELAKKATVIKNDPKALQELLDQHGTGRIYLRNTRKMMSSEYSFFPKRFLKPYPLKIQVKTEEVEYNLKIEWLVSFLSKNQHEKILLICRSKTKIKKIEKDLREMSVNNKVSLFHGDLSLMARDRQAAYFSDPKGANILLSSEIGSEGRNFEFSSNLILFDLPDNPDLLEQRIGRLDRIGQKFDIKIHVPYVEQTYEELVFNFYHKVINGFESSPKGAGHIFEKFFKELDYNYQKNDEYFKTNALDSLVLKYKENFNNMQEELEAGRDHLIELNSFNQEVATKLIKDIRNACPNELSHNKLKEYLENVFTHFGVDVEDLDEDSQYIKPGDNMFIAHFPHLSTDGFSLTYNRWKALEREELQYMTWDHPLVTSIIDLILSEEFGNLTIAMRENTKAPNIFLETFYKLNCTAPKNLEVGSYLPSSFIRVLINIDGVNFTQKWTKETLDSKLINATRDIIEQVSKIPKDKLKTLLDKAKDIANLEAKDRIESALKSTSNHLGPEINRLEQLKKVNPLIKDTDIDKLIERELLVKSFIHEAEIELDCFRFIY